MVANAERGPRLQCWFGDENEAGGGEIDNGREMYRRLMVGFVARKRGQESGSILNSASELLIGLYRITLTAEIYGTPLQSAFEKKGNQPEAPECVEE